MPESIPCQNCSAPATIHLTQIADGKVVKVHLCDKCSGAEALGIAGLTLAKLLDANPEPNEESDREPGLTCPDCGLTESAFRKSSRLGCATCYTVYSEAIAALLPRVQPAFAHGGKHPLAHRDHARAAELRRAREALALAIREERYEDAGRLRDRIRELDTEDKK